jgi:membrane-associated phospholipid phosphatase
VGGQVTPHTLFRGKTPGELIGPYLSQFMLLPTPFGAEVIDRRMRTPIAGDDYLTDYAEWLAIQSGALPPGPNQLDSTRRYLRNGRDLGEWVHIDVLFQAYFNALLILFRLGAPFDPSNPYRNSHTQIAFGTFGPPFMASLLCAVAREALKAVWFQKWFVHRRLRPEAFAGRVHNHLTGAAHYPIHQDALNSSAVDAVFAAHGTYLLPMAFPEGSPTHPAYGAGHATVAGACVTALRRELRDSRSRGGERGRPLARAVSRGSAHAGRGAEQARFQRRPGPQQRGGALAFGRRRVVEAGRGGRHSLPERRAPDIPRGLQRVLPAEV